MGLYLFQNHVNLLLKQTKMKYSTTILIILFIGKLLVAGESKKESTILHEVYQKMYSSNYLSLNLDYSVHLDSLPKAYKELSSQFIKTPNYLWSKRGNEVSLITQSEFIQINHLNKTVIIYPANGELQKSHQKLPIDTILQDSVSLLNTNLTTTKKFKISYPTQSEYESMYVNVDAKSNKIREILIKSRELANIEGKDQEVFARIVFSKVSFTKPNLSLEQLINDIYKNNNGIYILSEKYKDYQFINYLK